MKGLLITAMHSGAGKTVMSCALLAALKNRGLRLQAFKCGPDYIDPMFHSRVLDVPCRNLDLFLQGEAGVRASVGRGSGDFMLIEGAMGYYDGVSGSDRASAYDVARLIRTPAVLVLRPKGGSLTLAAQVRGMTDFRPDSNIAALLLADCPQGLADRLTPILERETGLPVLGFLPPMEQARIESRHLGLLTAGEVAQLRQRFDALAAQAEKSVDLDRLLALAGGGLPAGKAKEPAACGPMIAVARDEAFCFLYEDNLDLLREAGAKLCFFSPLHDKAVPAGAEGLYLPGGYPELYAEALSANESMRKGVAAAVGAGIPTVAECGGFLYLQQSLADAQGRDWPMCGTLPGRGFGTGRLRRFGYELLEARDDSLLFRAGERIPAHEFHYWDSTDSGAALTARKPDGRSWSCGHAAANLYAAFPHLHFGGEFPLAERFVRACETCRTS